jgi:hypothetical protein
MKTKCLLIPALALCLASCSSRPKVDWNAIDWNGRVGHYTYDQAQTELGKPVGVSESNEGRAAEWTIKRSPQMSFGMGVGASSYGSSSATGVGVGTSVSPKPRGEYMRLQFGPDGVLKGWERVRY